MGIPNNYSFKNKKYKNLIILDMDGTIDGEIDGQYTNFRTVDNKIINELFSTNVIVNILNFFLWKINEKDIISNSMGIFVFRMHIYSILAFKNRKEVLSYYKKRYIELMEMYVVKKYNEEIVKLEDLGFEIAIYSHNIFTKDLKKYLPIKAIKHKGKYISKLKKQRKVAYVIGNNYMDDIYPSQRMGINVIYVGKSKLVKKIADKNLIVVNNTTEAIKIILEIEEGT